MRREKLGCWDPSRQFQRPPLKSYQGNVEAVLVERPPRSFPNVNSRIVKQIGIELGACGCLNIVWDTPSWHWSAGNVWQKPSADVYHSVLSMLVTVRRCVSPRDVEGGDLLARITRAPLTKDVTDVVASTPLYCPPG